MSMEKLDQKTRYLLIEHLKTEIKEYARLRQTDVARGAETPELAALLVEKYCMGLIKGICLIFDFFDQNFVTSELTAVMDEVVAEIDPQCAEHRKLRWAARPAGLLKGE